MANPLQNDLLLREHGTMDAERRIGTSMDMLVFDQPESVIISSLADYNGHAHFDNLQDALSQIGFGFHKVINVDNTLFHQVKMPAGWRKVGTDHSICSYLEDEKGRSRLSIFQKSTFYGHDAFVNIEQAIKVKTECEGEKIVVQVMKDNELIFSTEPVMAMGNVHDVYAVKDLERGKALSWVTRHYPDYGNPTAYWA